MPPKDVNQPDKGNFSGSRLAKSNLVLNNPHKGQGSDHVSKKKGKHDNVKSKGCKEQLQKRPNFGLPLLKRCLVKRQLPISTQNLILHSLKEGTRKSYKNYIEQWMIFC